MPELHFTHRVMCTHERTLQSSLNIIPIFSLSREIPGKINEPHSE